MFDEIRDRLLQHITKQSWAVLSVTGAEGPRSVPVRYHVDGINLHCRVPRWADIAYFIEQNPQVAVVIPENPPSELCWTEVQGQAAHMPEPDCSTLPPNHPAQATALYQFIRITPTRIERIDQTRGWGSRETLDLS